MILEFLDGSKIDVNAIFGGPQLVNGVLRDTLRIEVDPTTISFNDLKSHFKDNPKTSMLYSYTDGLDDSGNPIEVKNEIGEGYNIFVSISDEERKKSTPPGRIQPDQMEEVFVVTIAQMTYQEYHGSSQQGENVPQSEN